MNVLVRKLRSGLTRLRSLAMSQRFGVPPERIYRNSFYHDGGFSKTEHSADVIAQWAADQLMPASLLDLGCGAGHYLRAFEQLGINGFGLEASPEGVALAGPKVTALSFDLRRPVYFNRQFDLVICVEVAEHIPLKSSRNLVASIARNAGRYVLFTAAPPGTPGLDHINCQSPAFWHALFGESGFRVSDDLTDNLRETCKRANTAAWWFGWSWCLERVDREGRLVQPAARDEKGKTG